MKYKQKAIIFVLSIAVIGLCIVNHYISDDPGSIQAVNDVQIESSEDPKGENEIPKPSVPDTMARVSPAPKSLPGENRSIKQKVTDAEVHSGKVVPYEMLDAIKEQIYEINVEYIDDVDRLDSIVQKSAENPVELWGGDWVSVDDWKRHDDVFSIGTRNDGFFRLTPERDSTQSYSFDEEKNEFVWERDYYGKTITHKARFISSDVMVLMKITGVKVALDIYTREAG